jgi:hypothetical protein
MIEDRLHGMGQGYGLVHPEHVAGPLEGMHGPKHPIDQFHVPGGLLQFEKGPIELGQGFPHLFHEQISHPAVQGHPRSPGAFAPSGRRSLPPRTPARENLPECVGRAS